MNARHKIVHRFQWCNIIHSNPLFAALATMHRPPRTHAHCPGLVCQGTLVGTGGGQLHITVTVAHDDLRHGAAAL